MSTAKVIKSESGQIKTRYTAPKAKTSEANVRREGKTSPPQKRVSSCQRCHHNNQQEAKKKTIPLKHTVTNSHQKEPNQHRTRHRTGYEVSSQNAFTVIAPDAKKRNEIQQQAKAELAALEQFKLNRAMGHVSITPRRLGGRLTLEEVRLKQQQEIQMSQKKGSSSMKM